MVRPPGCMTGLPFLSVPCGKGMLGMDSVCFEISGVHVGAKQLRADVRLMGCELFWAQTIQDDTGAPHILQERQKRAAKMGPEFLVETAPECVLIKLL